VNASSVGFLPCRNRVALLVARQDALKFFNEVAWGYTFMNGGSEARNSAACLKLDVLVVANASLASATATLTAISPRIEVRGLANNR
jgi:hypothetical protein